MMKGFATKGDLGKLEGKVEDLSSTMQAYGTDIATLRTELKSISTILSDILGSLRWATRLVLGALLSGGVLAAAHFLSGGGL